MAEDFGREQLPTETLVPLTILQALRAGDFRVDGQELATIRIIGCVANKHAHGDHNIVYAVEDGTGRIDCLALVSATQAQIAIGDYVVVHGTLQRNFKHWIGENEYGSWISARDVRPVVGDFNVITHHYLEAIYLHEKRTNALPKCAGKMEATTEDTPERPAA